MSTKIRILCLGAGNTGRSHILAYHHMPDFEIVGICTRRPASRRAVLEELGTAYPEFDDFETALAETRPDAVCIATYPDTHYTYAHAALRAGCHVFVEKPLAETLEEARALIALAAQVKRKLMIGYVLRVHPGWSRFIGEVQRLGKPLVMRMNLNQQSFGAEWETHKQLLRSMSPVVDCGVHYVDVMSQMTGARPVRVSGIGAQLTDEVPEGKINYAHLQVTFDDGSVGWYEAGWGPMMSETAFFVKDVIGPKGCVSIVAEQSGARGQSAKIESHTGAQSLRIHPAERNADGGPAREDTVIPLTDEPDHDTLFHREQEAFLDAIQNDRDLTRMHECVYDSMRIVLAADESFRTGKTVELA